MSVLCCSLFGLHITFSSGLIIIVKPVCFFSLYLNNSSLSYHMLPGQFEAIIYEATLKVKEITARQDNLSAESKKSGRI